MTRNMWDVILNTEKTCKTSLELFHELKRQKKGDEGQHKNLDSVKCGDAYRSSIEKLRNSSLGSLSIYTEIFVADGLYLLRFFYLMIAVIIKIIIPAAIIWTQQPIEKIEESPKSCPNSSNGLTKLFGFTLSLFFVRLTNDMCNHKLSGLMFLRIFCNLGLSRRTILDIGILNQMLGMAAAGGCQFLLFVGNGHGAYVTLLLQSLAMQFCLTVDTKVLTDPEETKSKVKALAQGHLLCDGEGIGDVGQPMPTITAKTLHFFLRLEAFVNMCIMFVGIVWSVALAYCI